LGRARRSGNVKAARNDAGRLREIARRSLREHPGRYRRESVRAERPRCSGQLRDDLLGVFGSNVGVRAKGPGQGALSPQGASQRAELTRLTGRSGRGLAVPERRPECDCVVPVFSVFVHEQLHVFGTFARVPKERDVSMTVSRQGRGGNGLRLQGMVDMSTITS